MFLTWRNINTILIIIFVIPKETTQNSKHITLGHETIKTNAPNDWRRIEALAEEYPYIVALLTEMKDYICTGTVIHKVSVLTSGNCVTYEPKYIAVNAAVYNKKHNYNTIFNIAGTTIHGDYIFQLQTGNPNITRMHSNIGLIFVDRPFLEIFMNVADLGNFYASELKDKHLLTIGYGELGSSNLIGLQYQAYQQTPCMNPKWYYCVCGIEISTRTKSYIAEFGKGGPVLLGSTIIGVTAASSGTLFLKKSEVMYNVFTVLGPYLPWIEKMQESKAYNKTVILRSTGVSIQYSMFLKHFHTLIVIIKMFF